MADGKDVVLLNAGDSGHGKVVQGHTQGHDTIIIITKIILIDALHDRFAVFAERCGKSGKRAVWVGLLAEWRSKDLIVRVLEKIGGLDEELKIEILPPFLPPPQK